MRFFLCGFEHCLLGIPADAVASLIAYTRPVSRPVSRDPGGDWYFSIPHFFGFQDQRIRHGIMLKPLAQPYAKRLLPESALAQASGPPNALCPAETKAGPRNVLLVNTVEREEDIPPEDIQRLPKLFAEQAETAFYTGFWFDESSLIAFINPAPLIARIMRDYAGDWHD
ncbi:MAG: hypothetical protein LBD37_02035 [Treponema sp.]|jgi:hypothetical protein|nr:hypothetical protein [Treponema sp.]